MSVTIRTPKVYFLPWAMAALWSAAVAAEEAPTVLSPGLDSAPQSVVEEDEYWTWFGMGYESRHRRRAGEGFGFGPETRPSGGFGDGSSGFGRSSGVNGQGGRAGVGNRGNASGRGR